MNDNHKNFSLYGIIGYPLSQTLSPLLHTTSFHDQSIASVLVPWQIAPTDIEQFIKSFRLLNINGCCVTIPHKKTVIPYLDKITTRASKVGAVNLLYWKDNELWGDNTDVKGFMKPLENNNLINQDEPVLLLGSGGAARAVVVGLQLLGFKDITITGTNELLNQTLQKEFNLKKVTWDERHKVTASLIINATPAGMSGKFENESPYEMSWFKGKGTAYDIVYTPLETKFLSYAKRRGWHTISGLDMFIAQANEQYKTWTNNNLSKSAVNLIKSHLEAKANEQ